MKRKIELNFFDFDEHTDLSFIDNSKFEITIYRKGGRRKNGSKQPYNGVYFSYDGDLEDEYDARIFKMIDLFGEANIKKLSSAYNAKSQSILLWVPCKTSEWNEEGYLSVETMRKLCDLDLMIEFMYY